MLSSWSSSLAIPGSSSRCTLQQQNVVAGSTTPPLAVAAAETARRRRRRSEGFMSIGGAGATRAEIELDQKLHESDQLVQVSSASKDSIKQIRRDVGVALLNKSAATAQTSVKQSLDDTAAVWRTREWLLDEARDFMAQAVDDRGGPPRWYCPVEAAGFPENAPLLLCLPDIISNGLSIKLHQQKLARLFEVRCLHVPFYDQTPYDSLLEQVEAVIQEEQSFQPNRTIYLMGQGYGALLALLLAAHNPDLDLVLVLVDPATWCDGYQVLSPFQSLLEAVTPGPISLSLPFLFSLTFGDLASLTKAVNMMDSSSGPQLKQVQQRAVFLKDLLQILTSTATAGWSKAQCQWKVKQLQLAAYNANRQLREVKADVLLLASGKEQNVTAAKKLKQFLPSCTVRIFKNSNPALLLDERVQVSSLIKATNLYRVSKYRDIALDYLPPTEDEVKTFHESHIRILKQLFSPIFFTVGKDSKMKRGLPQITKEHPILFIGNHTFVGLDLAIIVNAFLEDQNVMIRSLAHPALTADVARGLQESGIQDVARLFGAVSVTGSNLYKLMAAHEAVLLLPGGVREALKSKGDAYKLLWPKKAEFVRTAIRHGATIIPVAAVGGDDFIQILLDQEQVLQFPVIGEIIRIMGANMPHARVGNRTERSDQPFLAPLGLPKLPPRMYFAFQQPIYTYEFPQLLHDKEAVDKLYKLVQSEIESGLDYLLQKRKEDTYESFIPRAIFEGTWGHSAPTFKP
ncbi:unnamed protein product [Sphagnum troendelagicum]